MISFTAPTLNLEAYPTENTVTATFCLISVGACASIVAYGVLFAVLRGLFANVLGGHTIENLPSGHSVVARIPEHGNDETFGVYAP